MSSPCTNGNPRVALQFPFMLVGGNSVFEHDIQHPDLDRKYIKITAALGLRGPWVLRLQDTLTLIACSY